MTEPPGLRTLVVGLDAACRPVLGPLFDAGVTPRMRTLFEDGTSGSLESVLPPWTPVAWPSLYTGVNPGKHGVFDFLSFDGYDWDVVSRSDVHEFALWEHVDRAGLSSVVVNVPVTNPPDEVRGAIVPGYVASDDPACHPEGVLDDLRDELGEYYVYSRHDKENRAESIAEYRHLTRLRGEAFRYLADRFDPDFGFVQFQMTDTVFHEQPGDWEAVEATYGAVDDEVGRILDECDPDTVFVVSDHGIGPYRGHEVRVNELLRDEGFVETTSGGRGMPSWSSIARNRLKSCPDDESVPIAERVLATAARFGVTSQRVYAVLDGLGIADAVAAAVPSDVVRAATEQVDFPHSTAYVRSRIELGVRLNVAGREPDGVVEPGEYEATRDAVADALRAVRTPEGDPLFERVVPREAVFDGPFVDRAPDLLTIPANFEHLLSASLRTPTFADATDVWNHKRAGVVAASGEGIDDAVAFDGAHLLDVAPTVLATLGLPATDRMDGTSLPFVEAEGVDRIDPYDPEGATVHGSTVDEEFVTDQLSALGYVEE